MRLLAWAVAVPVTLAVVLFTLSNRQTVTLALFPFPSTIDAPVYLVGFAGALVGFLAGGLIAWLSGRHRWRQRVREAARDRHKAQVETARLKRQLAAAKRPPEAGSTEPAAAATAQAPERRLAIADATRNP
jgi:uncharacterized integral membrane protein